MGIEVGDKLRVLSALAIYHYGIYIGSWGHYRECVVHNAKFKQVEIATLAVFSDGRQVEIAERVARTPWDASEIVDRALSVVGRRYDLLNFNCEHVVSYALKGQAVSPTARAAVAVTVLVGIVLLGRG